MYLCVQVYPTSLLARGTMRKQHGVHKQSTKLCHRGVVVPWTTICPHYVDRCDLTCWRSNYSGTHGTTTTRWRRVAWVVAHPVPSVSATDWRCCITASCTPWCTRTPSATNQQVRTLQGYSQARRCQTTGSGWTVLEIWAIFSILSQQIVRWQRICCRS